MNTILLRALLAVVAAGILCSGSIVSFSREKTLWTLLQLLGTGCLVLVALTHVCEVINLFPRMRWGHEHSAAHYLDFWSVVVGLTLFPVGYLFAALARRHA
jgi:hypothetical protein